MKILLQSHDRFDDFAEFDPATGDLAIYSKSRNRDKWSDETVGFFARINGKPAVLFRVNHDLFFGYSGKLFTITDLTSAKVEGGEVDRRFVLSNPEGSMVSIDYKIPKSSIPPELDFTQTEPEHFDFLLFVRNLLKNPARRELMRGIPRE